MRSEKVFCALFVAGRILVSDYAGFDFDKAAVFLRLFEGYFCAFGLDKVRKCRYFTVRDKKLLKMLCFAKRHLIDRWNY